MEKENSLTIIGGGITGLAAAYIAAKQKVKVRVIEGEKNFGGLLNTFEIGGTRLEFFYHHFFTHDMEIHWLIKELGIEDKLIYKKTTMGTFRNGKLYPFNGIIDLLKFSPIDFIGKIKWGLSSLYLGKLAKWEKYENVTALEWFYKNAGKSATNSLWKPMLDIKFGPYSNKIPLSWMIGRLRQRLNSRKSGDERLGYLEGGLDTLLQALLSKLKELGVELVNEAPVTSLNFDSNNKLQSIETAKGQFSDSRFLFTIQGTIISNLLPQNSLTQKKYASIEYFGAVCVILEIKQKLSDIYWINVADPGYNFGGIIEHTNFINPENYNGKHITYLSRYFDLKDPLFRATDDEIKQKMIPQLKSIFPNFNTQDIDKVYVFRTSSAATVCDLEFSKKIPNCETEFEGLFVANMAHLYPDERSVNNSIRVAAEACKKMNLKQVDVPEGNSLAGKLGF